MSSPIVISGSGAVSPAGWGVPALITALDTGEMPSPSEIVRPLGDTVIRTPVLRVPATGSTVPKNSRLRRASPISKFAAAATIEALGAERIAASISGELRIGVIFTLTNGCVNYSSRFFGEVLSDPSVASPILFPETVFNAPSSHLSAMIGGRSPNDTLVTDGTGIFTGMDLAAEWLQRGDVDGCVVVCGEEIDWLSAEALLHYSRSYLPSEGAAAVYLEKGEGPVKLLRLPDPISFSAATRSRAAHEIQSAIGTADDGETLWVDGTIGNLRIDRAEESAWAGWKGPRISPRKILGESMGASAGFQMVAAVDAIRTGRSARALVTALGGNQQAAAALIGG